MVKSHTYIHIINAAKPNQCFKNISLNSHYAIFNSCIVFFHLLSTDPLAGSLADMCLFSLSLAEVVQKESSL